MHLVVVLGCASANGGKEINVCLNVLLLWFAARMGEALVCPPYGALTLLDCACSNERLCESSCGFVF